MRHLIIFEKWNSLNEASTTPNIDFNKLPFKVYSQDNEEDDKKLWAAGFPKIEDKMERNGFKPPKKDLNFLRYYTYLGDEYQRKQKAPTPNYII